MNSTTAINSVKPVEPVIQPPPPPRSIRVICGPLPPEGALYIKIRVDRDEAEYRVTKQPSDFGDAFLVEKIDGILLLATYHVNLSDEGHLCDCDGCCWKGTCRHIEGLAALRRARKL